jgi:hypothetical protein
MRCPLRPRRLDGDGRSEHDGASRLLPGCRTGRPSECSGAGTGCRLRCGGSRRLPCSSPGRRGRGLRARWPGRRRRGRRGRSGRSSDRRRCSRYATRGDYRPGSGFETRRRGGRRTRQCNDENVRWDSQRTSRTRPSGPGDARACMNPRRSGRVGRCGPGCAGCGLRACRSGTAGSASDCAARRRPDTL